MRSSAVVSSGGDNLPLDQQGMDAVDAMVARLRSAASAAGGHAAQEPFGAPRGTSLLGAAFGRTALPPDDPPEQGPWGPGGGGGPGARGGEGCGRGRGRGGQQEEGPEEPGRGGGGGGGSRLQGQSGQHQDEFSNMAELSKMPLSKMTGVLRLLSAGQAQEGGKE
jgi:hypothetical protein